MLHGKLPQEPEYHSVLQEDRKGRALYFAVIPTISIFILQDSLRKVNYYFENYFPKLVETENPFHFAQ